MTEQGAFEIPSHSVGVSLHLRWRVRERALSLDEILEALNAEVVEPAAGGAAHHANGDVRFDLGPSMLDLTMAKLREQQRIAPHVEPPPGGWPEDGPRIAPRVAPPPGGWSR